MSTSFDLVVKFSPSITPVIFMTLQSGIVYYFACKHKPLFETIFLAHQSNCVKWCYLRHSHYMSDFPCFNTCLYVFGFITCLYVRFKLLVTKKNVFSSSDFYLNPPPSKKYIRVYIMRLISKSSNIFYS